MTEKKLRFFKTSSRQFTETHSSIFQKLRMKLEGSRIESRIVKLHPNREDSDEDVLSYYAILEGDYLFGMIIRISTKRNVKAIPVDYTHLDNLKFSDMPEVNDANHERYCTSHYYFILKGNYLVTDLPHNMTITRFQDFINKLLDQEEKYNYVPMLDTGQISMNEVTKIVVRDKSIEGEQIQSTGNPIMSKIRQVQHRSAIG